VSIINAFSQIMLCIYSFIGNVSISQIELLLERVLLRLAEGKTTGSAKRLSHANVLQVMAIEVNLSGLAVKLVG
jgi:hypothetical protein